MDIERESYFSISISSTLQVKRGQLAAPLTTHLYEGRVFWPGLQPLFHCDTQLLQDRETETGLAHVGLLVEVIRSF